MAVTEARNVPLDGWTLTVRTALEGDAPSVHSLFLAVYGETDFLSRSPDEISDKYDLLEKKLRNHVNSETELFLIAEKGERVIGMASLSRSKLRRMAHGAELAIAVSKDFWGLGVGRCLMQAMLDWADNCGLVRIDLEVAATNSRAIRLYESLGFEVEGRLRARRKHGETFVDGLIMAKVHPGALSFVKE